MFFMQVAGTIFIAQDGKWHHVPAVGELYSKQLSQKNKPDELVEFGIHDQNETQSYANWL